MKHRIFIAINLPLEVRMKLLKWKTYLPDLPARWTKTESIHITLVFVGYVLPSELEEIVRVSREVAARDNFFELQINRVRFGPPQGPPRMIWAEIKNSEELLRLQQDLQRSLYGNPHTGYHEKETRPYSPHLTLARFDPDVFRRLTPKPILNQECTETFPVTTIDVMESTLSRSGAEYSLLKAIPLNRM